MRRGTVTVLAAALAAVMAAGCGSLAKKLNFTDQADKDWSGYMTAPNSHLDLDAPHKVLVKEFQADLAGPSPKVKVTLVNQGEVEDLFSVDLQFGYPAPEGSFAEFETKQVTLQAVNFQVGKSFTKEVPAPAGMKERPVFARLLTEVWATAGREMSANPAPKGTKRTGTLLLDDQVEVVKVGGSLDAAKPTLSFTLENVGSDKDIGDLQYKIEFYKDGKSLALGPFFKGLRPVGTPLGGKGKQVSFEVTRLETVPVSLAGAKPVLRLVQAQ